MYLLGYTIIGILAVVLLICYIGLIGGVMSLFASTVNARREQIARSRDKHKK